MMGFIIGFLSASLVWFCVAKLKWLDDLTEEDVKGIKDELGRS